MTSQTLCAATRVEMTAPERRRRAMMKDIIIVWFIFVYIEEGCYLSFDIAKEMRKNVVGIM